MKYPWQASQYRKLCAMVDVQPGVCLSIYGRGRNRTLALYRSRDRKVLTKTHYSKATQEEAAEAIARSMTLDGELPIGMQH